MSLPPGWANSQIHDKIKSNNGRVISKISLVSNDIMLSTETKKVTKKTYNPEAVVSQSKKTEGVVKNRQEFNPYRIWQVMQNQRFCQSRNFNHCER
jgi:hypothetical protein